MSDVSCAVPHVHSFDVHSPHADPVVFVTGHKDGKDRILLVQQELLALFDATVGARNQTIPFQSMFSNTPT